MRIGAYDDTVALARNLRELEKTLIKFRNLESIVLETFDAESAGISHHHVEQLAAMLRATVQVEVQCRTSAGAHQIALRAKTSSAIARAGGLVSPYWCFAKHSATWKER